MLARLLERTVQMQTQDSKIDSAQIYQITHASH